MGKKIYIVPESEFVKIDALTMLAASIGIGKGDADAGHSFSNERRGVWGNLWE